jgi:IS1 family transposase
MLTYLFLLKSFANYVRACHRAKAFRCLWKIVATWQCYFYVTDSEAVAAKGASGWPVYPGFIPEGDQIVRKTYMTRVEGENTRLRHDLARLHRKTLCCSKTVATLKYSIRLLLHYLKFWDVPVPQ